MSFKKFAEAKGWLPRPQAGQTNKKCPDCGTENPAEANFCFVCGVNPKAEGKKWLRSADHFDYDAHRDTGARRPPASAL